MNDFAAVLCNTVNAFMKAAYSVLASASKLAATQLFILSKKLARTGVPLLADAPAPKMKTISDKR